MPSGSCRHRSPGKDTPGGGEASRQQEEPSFRSQEALVPAFPGLFRSLAALGTSLTLLASPPGPGGRQRRWQVSPKQWPPRSRRGAIQAVPGVQPARRPRPSSGVCQARGRSPFTAAALTARVLKALPSFKPILFPRQKQLASCADGGFCLHFFFSLFRVTPAAYGGSQARGRIGAAAETYATATAALGSSSI